MYKNLILITSLIRRCWSVLGSADVSVTERRQDEEVEAWKKAQVIRADLQGTVPSFTWSFVQLITMKECSFSFSQWRKISYAAPRLLESLSKAYWT